MFLLDEAYSKLMLTEGDVTPVDVDPDYKVELPPWADVKRIKM